MLGKNYRRKTKAKFPQERYFTRHIADLISPVGYEDEYISHEKAQASADFTSNVNSEFVDTTAETGLWSQMLKETIKKYLFLFGFGRINKIRKASDALYR